MMEKNMNKEVKDVARKYNGKCKRTKSKYI